MLQLGFSSFVIIILLTLILAPCATKASNISILVSLPLYQISGPKTSWERGFEILPGAHLAVSAINNDSTILRGHNLQIVVADSGRDENDILQKFVNLIFHQIHKKIVGVSGILEPKAASILMLLARRKGVLLSAITHTDQLDIPVSDYSGAFLSLPSPSATVSVLLNFMWEMNWKRIGLVTDSTDAYFFGAAEMLLQVAKINDSIIVSPYIELFHVTSDIHEIAKLKTRVIFVSLNAEKAIQLLCAVHEKRLLWPEYAWIFHSFQIEDLLDQQSVCDIKKAANGIFLIDSQPWSDPSQTKLLSGNTFTNYYKQYLSSLSEAACENNITLRPNGYAKLLYDSVWTMAIALNKSCDQSATCIYQKDSEATAVQVQESYQGQNDWIFNIFHIRMPKPVLISIMHYSNSSVMTTSFNTTILANAPTSELPLVTADPPLVYTVVLGIQIPLTMVFVTLVFVLYIYFHKEPEIRATSFTLSLLMFAGCYLNLLYLSLLFYSNHKVHSINIGRDDALCLSLIWLSAPGISLPLMLATLLVKMLRLYHIFHNTRLRLGRYCSDISLAFYVLLILIPDVFVNLLWAFVDRYQIHFEYQMRDGYIHLEKVCTSKYEIQIFGVLIIYLLVLILALAIVAIITRKVRLQHFKDTKKVNTLLFIFCTGIIIVFSYWLLLQTQDTKRYIKNLPLYIGHSVLVVSFLSLLFVPKVFPPLWRRIKDK